MQLEFPLRSWVSCLLTDARWPYETDNFSTQKAVDGIEFYPFAKLCMHYLSLWKKATSIYDSDYQYHTRQNSVSVKVTETPVIQQEATPGPATGGWARLVSSTSCWDLEKVSQLRNATFPDQKKTILRLSHSSNSCSSQCSGLTTT